MGLKTISIHVSGRVQGVYFRQTCKEVAKELGITGTVRNLPDETVEIAATGSEEQLKKLADWAAQGPPAASVEKLDVKEVPLKEFEGFKIVH